MNKQHIDSSLLKRMIISGAKYLERKKQEVDELNVFPVPDGDTGTNMSLTILAAAKELQKMDFDRVDEVAKAASSGSLRGARGNSGVILSQLFRGFAKGLQGQENITSSSLAQAFQSGVETAYKAVMKPKEGTILTVAKECAEKANELVETNTDLEIVCKKALEHAYDTLQKTPDMLPVLKEAGVVDAGGQGLLYILEGAYHVLIGKEEEIEFFVEEEDKEKHSFRHLTGIDHEDIKFGYCTELIINKPDGIFDESVIEELKTYLTKIGDSIVVVGDEELIKIHVHTNHPGQVFEKGLTLGFLTNMKVDNMRIQHTSKVITEQTKIAKEKPATNKAIGFISIAIGHGIKEVFKGLGVDYVIEGGQTMNPSTEDILNAIDQTPADTIIILPNNKNIILAAEQAVDLCKDKKIIVIPTRTIPQGISAMLGYEPGRSLKQNIETMEVNISMVKTGQITYAIRNTMIEGQKINQGDILGIIDEEIKIITQDLQQNAKQLLDKMIDEETDIITIYYGQDTTQEQAEDLGHYIEIQYPECEVEIHNGGQPLYYYIFSVE
ncbi:MAG: DAK2 domain-containing protein [Epulopiscium sp.]|nr:DAK2 domain-containing protein [Candidatus Epulonipiscium sp.]